ncbi:MAG TPA: chromate efflux transporter [Thermoanaerobaculia bacterium]|nr:chromate efflux transporter [Thermoanaerobaculia bacterium]
MKQQRPSEPPATSEPLEPVTFSAALRFWLQLGFISFGGPAGQIAIMHRELVERRRWISEDRFLHALNYCMLLPGPEAQQLATYIGWLLHRVRGGLVAGILFILPSVFILLGLSYAYAAHGGSPLVAGVLQGVRPVVVAIILEAVLRLGRRVIRRRDHLLISLLAFASIHWLGVPFPAIVLGAALVGWLAWRALPELGATGEIISPHPTDPPPAHARPSYRRFVQYLATAIALWMAGFVLLVAWRGSGSLHVDEYRFFTKAAFVTFGGAYAVLAYVMQAAVDGFGWITQAQAIDGLALAETTPGPLIMVVQFVGFLGAWNHPQGLDPLTSAIVGALATSFVTFLPSFLFIFLGAPYVEILRGNRVVSAALGGITAAVVGVVLHLAVVFGAAVLLPAGEAMVIDPAATGITLAAFLALWRFRMHVVRVILAGGLLGLLMAIVTN